MDGATVCVRAGGEEPARETARNMDYVIGPRPARVPASGCQHDMCSLKREAIKHLHMQLMPMHPFFPHSSAATAGPYPEATGGGDGVPPPHLNVLKERVAQSAAAAKAAAAESAAKAARARAAADAAELQRAEEDDAAANTYFALMRERESMRGSMRCGGTMLM